MSKKIYKNYQVSLGIPFQVRTPINFQTIKTSDILEDFNDEQSISDTEVDPEIIVARAKEEAEIILEEAKYEAARIMEKAQEDARENISLLEEQARQKGYDEGYNEAKLEYEDLIQEAELIRDHAKIEYKDFLAGIETDVVNIVLDISRNVIGTEISFHKDNILYLIKDAFEKCGNKERVVLKASAEDFDFIVANKEKLITMVEGIGELKIKKDNSLKVGACIIETPYGSIDGGVQTKLKKINEAFRQLIGK